MHVVAIYACANVGGLGACSPRKILIFRCSETTSSAFSGMMNSIRENILCKFTEQYTTHSDL